MSNKSHIVHVLKTGFTKKLMEVLHHFDDPLWLGEQSPLATPYFLGEYLLHHPTYEVDNLMIRGQVLQDLIANTVEKLHSQGKEQDYYDIFLVFYLLPWYDYKFDSQKGYLSLQGRRSNVQRMTKKEGAEIVGRSYKTMHYHLSNKLEAAVERLAQLLIRTLRPALRQNLPRFYSIIGRQEIVEHCRRELFNGKMIALTGPGGIGKTALGLQLAHDPVFITFWFTMQPGLNDDLHSLLFDLGSFLQEKLKMKGNGSSLFAEVVSKRGQVKIDLAIKLLQRDIAMLKQNYVLLCFDEMDLLRPFELETHASIRLCLDKLRELALPILVIGQTQVLESDEHIALGSLASAEVKQMLIEADIDLSQKGFDNLMAYTGGVPRLIRLFIALYKNNIDLETILSNLPHTLSAQFLLDRLWQRLNDIAQKTLTSLAVFRRFAPRDAWSNEEQEVLTHLIDWQLIEVDTQGGIRLSLFLRETIYKFSSLDLKQGHHCWAARVRVDRGEYTAAAYHLVKGGLVAEAVWLWHQHRRLEIEQGQSNWALHIFEDISSNQVYRQDREALMVLQAELQTLIGDYNKALQTLRYTIRYSEPLQAEAERLKGNIADLKKEYSWAIDAYQTGLQTITKLLSEKSIFHKNLAWVYHRDHQFDKAYEQADLAHYEAENNLGLLHMLDGRYKQAKHYYKMALEIATTMDYNEGQAKTLDNLGYLLTYTGQYKEAEKCLQQAFEFYKQIGRATRLGGVQIQLAQLYNVCEEYEQALVIAQKALSHFEDINEVGGIAAADQNLAEAYLGLQDLTQATCFARRVIESEDAFALPDGLRVMGLIKAEQDLFNEAERLIKQAIAIAQQSHNQYLEAWSWRDLMRVYIKQAKTQDVLTTKEQTISLFEKLELPHEVEKTNQYYNQFLV